MKRPVRPSKPAKPANPNWDTTLLPKAAVAPVKGRWQRILDRFAPEMYWDDDVSTLDRLDSGRYHH